MSCGKQFLAFRLSVRFKLSQEEGAWTVLSWGWRQYTVELATTPCEWWLLQ